MERLKDDFNDMIKLLNRSLSLKTRTLAVVAPYDKATLESVSLAAQHRIVNPILVGEKEKIQRCAEHYGVNVDGFSLLPTKSDDVMEKSGRLMLDGEADFIMKGLVGTGSFIHVLLDPRWKLRTERILSHVGMFETPHPRRVFLLSDAGINILPNFNRKIHIVANAVDAARKLGIEKIKVAMLAAVEKVNLPAMPATLDAFLMKKFSETGCFGECEIDGPFALDNALDPECAETKGISGNVAGNANLVIVPNIETGNAIWKIIASLEGRPAAGVVLGATCPIVLPSRADDTQVKYLSIQFSRLLLDQ